MSSSFKTNRIRTLDQLMEHWPLFSEGLEYLNGLVPEEKKLDTMAFFGAAVNALRKGEKKGHVAVYSEDTSGPFGFTITFASDSPFDQVPTAVIYAAYTRRTITGASRYGLSHVEKWAKGAGFEELQAFTPRINGKGFALFEKRFKFRRWLVCFVKRI